MSSVLILYRGSGAKLVRWCWRNRYRPLGGRAQAQRRFAQQEAWFLPACRWRYHFDHL